MADIVERLRKYGNEHALDLGHDAADEIERLQAKVRERYRAGMDALKVISEMSRLMEEEKAGAARAMRDRLMPLVRETIRDHWSNDWVHTAGHVLAEMDTLRYPFGAVDFRGEEQLRIDNDRLRKENERLKRLMGEDEVAQP